MGIHCGRNTLEGLHLPGGLAMQQACINRSTCATMSYLGLFMYVHFDLYGASSARPWTKYRRFTGIFITIFTPQLHSTRLLAHAQTSVWITVCVCVCVRVRMRVCLCGEITVDISNFHSWHFFKRLSAEPTISDSSQHLCETSSLCARVHPSMALETQDAAKRVCICANIPTDWNLFAMNTHVCS